jgi:sugar lactone lactonase YvrE
MRPEVVVRQDDRLGEGPAWDARTREILWVDILTSRLHAYSLDSATTRTTTFEEPVAAVVPRAAGGWAVTAASAVLLLGSDGSCEERVPVPTADGTRLGDAGVDPAGRLWFGALDADLAPGRGALYCLDAEHGLRRVVDGLSIANGIGWAPDGTLMYFIDSATRRIDAFDFDAERGVASRRRAWVTVEDSAGVPDGLAVDDEGGVWVAMWSGGRLHRYAPDGSLDGVVGFPVRQVTSCAFVGDALDVLAVTSGNVEMDDRARTAEPDAGSLFTLRPGVSGLPVPLFQG